ncbi:gluconate 2-dehydrogenase subunit 3 family protein [Chryseolinea lacunae]|uniref:Gluconate 2-dehydrogenase subunit 3 family protein n=1 Tax=Chryseolinea lacunae TaxID=2801331 RepID=A0ABS1KSQ5_9BACT|nr:gluconate 2-dehydrogenase subunit 3 family protein [Chryseolinea lacunae]MBL0742495.1 gluconate 2-dehydrogenase subunit 3 family protein [Chryseolinea lacunae]
MNRREAIQRTALALGYAISAPALAGVLNGCKAQPELPFQPVFFSVPEAATVAEMAEIILPKTSTPGAKDAGVPGFIDSMLKEVYKPQAQQKFLADLKAFDDDAEKSYGERFVDLDPEQQLAHFKRHHDAALASAGTGGSTGWWNAGKGGDKPFVLVVKELTLLGFFTSQPGATEVLQYKQVPGPYHGCVPLKEVGKAWAT